MINKKKIIITIAFLFLGIFLLLEFTSDISRYVPKKVTIFLKKNSFFA